MVQRASGESGDALPSGSPSPFSFLRGAAGTGMAGKLWLLARKELWGCGHGGASPSSPGTGGRGASSLKLLPGSGRWARSTALLMAPERGCGRLRELRAARSSQRGILGGSSLLKAVHLAIKEIQQLQQLPPGGVGIKLFLLDRGSFLQNIYLRF